MTSHRSPNKILKIWMVVLSVILVLSLAAAGATLAFLSTKTEPVDNQFEEAIVTCCVNRTGDVFDVTNTGNIHAFIRTAVVINWMDTDGNVRGIAPTDADVEFGLNTTDWVILDDGYFYYTSPVAPGQNTADLITSITLKTSVPQGYYLSVEVIAEAIQAEGVDNVTGIQPILDAWLSSLIN